MTSRHRRDRKCAEQLWGFYENNNGSLTFSVQTPCDRAPASLNITIVASPSGFGPFYYQSMLLPKSASGGRAANCPPPTPPVCNYPFVEPLTASCPPNGGGMAQYAAPCPDVPCISPPDKNGTCLIITSWPERKTPHANDKSIMAESKVELLTDDVTPASHHYITGSVPPPRAWSRDMTGWQLQVDGEVDRPTVFTMQDLQEMAQPVTRRYEFESDGMKPSLFTIPPASSMNPSLPRSLAPSLPHRYHCKAVVSTFTSAILR